MPTSMKSIGYWRDMGFQFTDTSDERIKIGRWTRDVWRVFYRDDCGDWDYTGPPQTTKHLAVIYAQTHVAAMFDGPAVMVESVTRLSKFPGETSKTSEVSALEALQEVAEMLRTGSEYGVRAYDGPEAKETTIEGSASDHLVYFFFK